MTLNRRRAVFLSAKAVSLTLGHRLRGVLRIAELNSRLLEARRVIAVLCDIIHTRSP
jgi:hypothetical protein